jgi:hypothetical protein
MEQALLGAADKMALDTKAVIRNMCNCGVTCCDNTSLSPEAFQQCFERCQQPLAQFQNAAQQEFQQLQVRITK